MNIRKATRMMFAVGCLAVLSQVSQPAVASVVIAGTRVVYNAGESEVTIKLSNEGQAPALVQSWVDTGDARAAPSDIKVPFTITPPISRIDPTRSQTLRIIYTGESLPQDRESVFWLNVLEIPPKPSAEDADVNKLQMAFRSRIKVFFRPSHLSGKPEDAPAKLSWRVTQADGKPAIEVHNPTAFDVSLTQISVKSGTQSASFDDGGMVEPGQTKTFPLTGDLAAANEGSVHYQWLNDYGGSVDAEAPLGQHVAQPSK